MRNVIAINKDETVRIIQEKSTYYLERLKEVEKWGIWSGVKETNQEWLASKWILDYELEIPSNYPTIKEIEKQQRSKK